MSLTVTHTALLLIAAPAAAATPAEAEAEALQVQQAVELSAASPVMIPVLAASTVQLPEDAGAPQGDGAVEETVTGEAVNEGEPATPEYPEYPEGTDVIIVERRVGAPPGDPLVQLNETTYQVSQKVDSALVEPVSEVYEEDLPKPLRNGLRNFLRNLMEPVNALNYLLQLNPGKAAETLGRFTINTTIGLAGLVDVAEEEPFNLPYRRNGFGNTMGYYGVDQGPFLVLPLIGATTLRDLVGTTLDQAVLPFAVGAPFNTPYYAVPAYTINSLQFRMEFDDRIDDINDSVYPYYALRESYLCNREADIAALRDLPPPRDCNIEALMDADDEPAQAAQPATPQPEAATPQREAAAPQPVVEE